MAVQTCPALPSMFLVMFVASLFQASSGTFSNAVCGQRLPTLSQCLCEYLLSPGGAEDTIVGVTCIDKNFQDPSVLKTLPHTIQHLTFVGNNLTELPKQNLFGVDHRTDKLVFLNMSNNNINKIYGKTFHEVGSVETLDLNNNQWELDEHTRALSNFYSLRKLYLNNAIKKQAYTPTMSHVTLLAWILEDSGLEQLEELHIQYNEIGFLNPDIFCPLKSLKVAHLANNVIFDSSGLVNADCMRNVEELYLHNNSLSYLTKYETDQLDQMVNNGKLKVLTLNNNTWRCACVCLDFLHWIQSDTSGANILGNTRYDLKCEPEEFAGILLVDVDMDKVRKTCPEAAHKRYKAPYIVIGILFSAIGVFIAAIIYMKRDSIKKRARTVKAPFTMSLRWNRSGPDYQGLV